MPETIENGQALVYNGPYGGAVPFSGAPSGRVYEAGKQSPNITADPADVEWLLARGFQRGEDDVSESQEVQMESDLLAKLRAENEALKEQLALAQSADPSKEYPNNAVLRVNPEDANTVRPDSDTTALDEQQNSESPLVTKRMNVSEESENEQQASRRGRPRKSDD